MSANSRTLVIPIYYGTISHYDKKSGDKIYYKWLSFLRSADNIDLSFLIEKVSFILHHTFKDPIRSRLISRDQVPVHRRGNRLRRVRDRDKDLLPRALPELLRRVAA